MFTLVVVEDDESEAARLKVFLEDFALENDEEFRISVFANGMDFVSSGKNFDLVFMDIDMPVMDGFEAAKKIRERKQDSLIIFITSLAQYAVKGYEVGASDYLLKPVNFYSLNLKLRKALGSIKRQEEKLVIKIGASVKILSASDIYFIEVRGHTMFYHTKDGEYRGTEKSSLKKTAEKLKPLGFSRCSHHAVVNLRYVRNMEGNSINVNGTVLQISENKKRDFYKDVLDFIK